MAAHATEPCEAYIVLVVEPGADKGLTHEADAAINRTPRMVTHDEIYLDYDGEIRRNSSRHLHCPIPTWDYKIGLLDTCDSPRRFIGDTLACTTATQDGVIRGGRRGERAGRDRQSTMAF